jgi:hypothetical protein
MVTLDATIMNVPLRAIGVDLGGAPSTARWVVDGHMVAFASLAFSPARRPTGAAFARAFSSA